MMKRMLRSSSSLLLMLVAFGAQAQLYKWVGPDGTVTYSDLPPPVAASRIDSRSGPASGTTAPGLPYELAEAVRSAPVTLYASKDCSPCDEGRALLVTRGIPFTEKSVSTNDDIAAVRRIGGDGHFPVLTIGRSTELGYAPRAWNSTLSAAGYPETSKLPRNYQNRPVEPAAPPVRPAAAGPRGTPANSATTPSGATELPSAVGNVPPGFRF